VARLHIYVTDKNEETFSKFGKPKDSDKIVFHNQHPSKTLTVTIQSEPQAGSALCKGNTAVDAFSVTPAEQKKSYTICKDYEAEIFKYTATIAGSAPEDPVIIIERAKFLESSAVQVGIGFVAGALVAVAVLKMMPVRTRPAA
jgi:hypothetical protein